MAAAYCDHKVRAQFDNQICSYYNKSSQGDPNRRRSNHVVVR